MAMEPQQIFDFYALASKLKTTVRHCWLGDEKRQESVADHCWGIILFASLIMPQLELKLDQLKVLKMLAYHDLAEAITGDIPATIKRNLDKAEVLKAEQKALQSMVAKLPADLAAEINSYWEEFERCESVEAIFAHAMDKAEAIIQHDLSPIETWDEDEYSLNVDYRDEYFNLDPYLRELKDYINLYNYWLVEKAGKLDSLTPKQKKFWQENKHRAKFGRLT